MIGHNSFLFALFSNVSCLFLVNYLFTRLNVVRIGLFYFYWIVTKSQTELSKNLFSLVFLARWLLCFAPECLYVVICDQSEIKTNGFFLLVNNVFADYCLLYLSCHAVAEVICTYKHFRKCCVF